MLAYKEIIVDASILFSFFKKDSKRRQLFEKLLNENCKLLSPHFVLDELRSDKGKIMQFSKASAGDFELAFSTIEDELELINEDEYGEFLSEAKQLSPHTKDDIYFASALSQNCPIWSDEKAFREQSKVRIFTTKELLDSLE